MPSRINHVKVTTREPQLVKTFLNEVCDLPGGWPIRENAAAAPLPEGAPLGPGGVLSWEDFHKARGKTTEQGYIVGDSNSRQFQILEADQDDAWAICISTRYIEEVYEKAVARGVPCTPITVADWNERDNIRNFFCVVGGLMFEVIRVEPKNA
ncbi:MAG: hypothetical protein AB7L13_15755 [Acidimicrobiia bacterium]